MVNDKAIFPERFNLPNGKTRDILPEERVTEYFLRCRSPEGIENVKER